MIKLIGTNDNGGACLVLGLSQWNWDRLLNDEPIHIDLSDLNLPWKGEILVMGGTTEQTMIHNLWRMGILRDVPVRHFDETKEQPQKREHEWDAISVRVSEIADTQHCLNCGIAAITAIDATNKYCSGRPAKAGASKDSSKSEG